jgi:hemoglobin
MRTLAPSVVIAAVFALIASASQAQDTASDQPQASLLPPKVMSIEHPAEEAVEPYQQSNANAGAAPFEGAAMYEAFHGAEGVSRIVDGFVQRNITDPRIMGQFAATDLVRLKRVLNEQFCYILGGGCAYTGHDMASSHAQLGSQPADMAAIVENLQAAMSDERIPFATQNRFLAKLAPMKHDVVTR